MTKRSYKEVEKQRREEEILTAAGRILVERGYANLNMDELAEAVGISKPTLYQHFKSKEELAVRVVFNSFKAMGELISRPLDEPAIDRLTGMIRLSLKNHTAGSILTGLRSELRPEMMWKVMNSYPGLEEHKAKFNERLYELVNKAKEEGAIDPDIPTPVVTHSLFALNRSLGDPALQAEYANSPEKLERAVNSIVRVFLYGVTPVPHSQSNTDVTYQEREKAN
jgi:AcrR family transcriptional regulator